MPKPAAMTDRISETAAKFRADETATASRNTKDTIP